MAMMLPNPAASSTARQIACTVKRQSEIVTLMSTNYRDVREQVILEKPVISDLITDDGLEAEIFPLPEKDPHESNGDDVIVRIER